MCEKSVKTANEISEFISKSLPPHFKSCFYDGEEFIIVDSLGKEIPLSREGKRLMLHQYWDVLYEVSKFHKTNPQVFEIPSSIEICDLLNREDFLKGVHGDRFWFIEENKIFGKSEIEGSYKIPLQILFVDADDKVPYQYHKKIKRYLEYKEK